MNANLDPKDQSAVELESREIWVGSLWHQDCDPFVTVVANDHDTAERKLSEASIDEWEEIWWSFECPYPVEEHANQQCDHEPDDDIKTGGVFRATVGEYKLSESELAELDRDGWVFINIHG